MNDDLTSLGQGESPPRSSGPGGERIRVGRRALLRAGAGATPVLLTIASNPVSAANGCVVASSFVSVATFKSRNPGVASISCATRTVEDWRQECAAKPDLACVIPAVSTCLGSTTSAYNSSTLRQALCAGTSVSTSGELGVLQHIIALRLCITQGFMRAASGNVSTAYLGNMWCNFKQNGNRYVLPASGIDWDSAKLVSWLRYQLNYSTGL